MLLTPLATLGAGPVLDEKVLQWLVTSHMANSCETDGICSQKLLRLKPFSTYLNALHLIFDCEICEETRLERERECGGQGSCRAG